jgi:BirA family transcriptional regulator, biotin operon repressor / biotin---[acetyl-CoA-carboxylase] ligase
MNRSGDILRFLRGSSGYTSGASMASRLGISRTAIWKYLKQLEQAGYTFKQRKGLGYRLKETPDRLYPWEIEEHLKTGTVGRKIHYVDCVDSTNAMAFRLAMSGDEEGTCVIAESQGAGRGRLQRRWHSPHGRNLYLSVILRPDIHPSEVYPLAFISSLAVYETLAASGLAPRLKWPNDVLIGGRKICGTLIELSTETDRVQFVIIGIGLNINMEEDEMDDEIRGKATSLSIETKIRFERAAICGMLLNNLERYYAISGRQGMDEICRLWEERAQTKGTFMEVRHFDRVYRGISEGIDDDGALLIRENDRIVRVIAGDVTV